MQGLFLEISRCWFFELRVTCEIVVCIYMRYVLAVHVVEIFCQRHNMIQCVGECGNHLTSLYLYHIISHRRRRIDILLAAVFCVFLGGE